MRMEKVRRTYVFGMGLVADERWGIAKDLSHVPCKFYKVGGCTAGASCPFSHTMTASTGDKDVCAWFVKGNCKVRFLVFLRGVGC